MCVTSHPVFIPRMDRADRYSHTDHSSQGPRANTGTATGVGGHFCHFGVLVVSGLFFHTLRSHNRGFNLTFSIIPVISGRNVAPKDRINKIIIIQSQKLSACPSLRKPLSSFRAKNKSWPKCLFVFFHKLALVALSCLQLYLKQFC